MTVLANINLSTVLHDDSSPYGGTDSPNESLLNFIQTSDIIDEEPSIMNYRLSDLNRNLHECGIEPLSSKADAIDNASDKKRNLTLLLDSLKDRALKPSDYHLTKHDRNELLNAGCTKAEISKTLGRLKGEALLNRKNQAQIKDELKQL